MNTIFTLMKHLKSPLSVLLVLFVVNACNTKTKEQTDVMSADSAALHNPVQQQLNSDQTNLLQTILGKPVTGNTAAIIRGIAFGDPVGRVRETETFEMFEEASDHVGYTSETTQLETIDVQYFLTPEKNVNRITVDVYLNSAAATTQLWNAGKAHFTENYAAPKQEKNTLIWVKNAVRVNMEDVSKGKDFGLKFEFSPLGKTAIAAK